MGRRDPGTVQRTPANLPTKRGGNKIGFSLAAVSERGMIGPGRNAARLRAVRCSIDHDYGRPVQLPYRSGTPGDAAQTRRVGAGNVPIEVALAEQYPRVAKLAFKGTIGVRNCRDMVADGEAIQRHHIEAALRKQPRTNKNAASPKGSGVLFDRDT